MKLSALERFDLKKTLKQLQKYRGRHTEMVSVYVPEGYELNKIIQQIQQEQGTATNIKSSGTRKNVTDALERLVQHLRLFKATPKNGLAVFSGNVSEKEGGSDVRVWSIEPHVPLRTKIYRCDKEFVLDPLLDMCELKEIYGLVVLDRRDATIAILKGKTIIPIRKTRSELPGKMKAGGQSAARFMRLREDAAKEHFRKIADYMADEFRKIVGLKGIIIGGPSITISDFMNRSNLAADMKQKILGTKDLSYTEDFGLQELLEKSEDLLAEEEVAEEKKIMRRFFEALSKRPASVSYGQADVKKVLELGAVDILLISEALSDEVIEEFEDLAKKVGSKVVIISQETREGVQLREMGKFAALLRYEIGDAAYQ